MSASLKETLASHVRAGELAHPLPKNWVQCVACGHRCKIAPDHDGICKIRFNRNGSLFVPSGYAAGIAVDPIEKKPFFHAYPGSGALSFGMLGCDYHCPFCQNWITSQTLHDPHAVASIQEISADELVDIALESRARIVTSTYNEPLITAEWGVEIFKKAKARGLVTAFVSNGNATPEVLDYLTPWIDLFKVDLKAFRQSTYSKVGGVLQNVLDTIKGLHDRGIWCEVVTLVIPGMNDSDEELRDIASFLVSVSPDIPWHVTAFHSDYQMESTPNTPSRTLLRAAEIGASAGIRYVYAGNLPGQTRNHENTYCHQCGESLIERHGFRILRYRLVDGHCPACHTLIPGRWE